MAKFSSSMRVRFWLMFLTISQPSDFLVRFHCSESISSTLYSMSDTFYPLPNLFLHETASYFFCYDEIAFVEIMFLRCSTGMWVVLFQLIIRAHNWEVFMVLEVDLQLFGCYTTIIYLLLIVTAYFTSPDCRKFLSHAHASILYHSFAGDKHPFRGLCFQDQALRSW